MRQYAGHQSCRGTLEGKTPDQVVAERLKAKRSLAKHTPQGRAGPCDMTKARLIADRAKEVSQPDGQVPDQRQVDPGTAAKLALAGA